MDLWPQDINQPLEIKSPYSLILEQSKLLGEKTNNIVEANVVKLEARSRYDFKYAFYLASPIANYSYSLFSFEFNLATYPVELFLDEDVFQEIPPEVVEAMTSEISQKEGTFLIIGSNCLIAENEELLLSLLKVIFNSAKTKKVISALYAMSKE